VLRYKERDAQDERAAITRERVVRRASGRICCRARATRVALKKKMSVMFYEAGAARAANFVVIDIHVMPARHRPRVDTLMTTMP